jgi:hypothetical protein
VADGSVPYLRVVRSDATPGEIAALVADLAAVAAARSRAADQAGRTPARAGWSAPARGMRIPLRPGADAWRRSVLPR